VYDHLRLACETVASAAELIGLDPKAVRDLSNDSGAGLGWAMEPEAVQLVLALIRATHPAVTVELGTCHGRTAALMAETLEELGGGRLYTVDNFSAVSRETARQRLAPYGSLVTLLEKSTVDAFADWGREPINLLVIDAAHDFPSAVTDLSLWVRLLAPSGWIVMHDTHTRLLRRFPEDYLFPLEHYVVLDIIHIENRPSGRCWQGLAFIRFRDRDWRRRLATMGAGASSAARVWSGALGG
jgi:predicted O-methyltransferase YrrM